MEEKEIIDRMLRDNAEFKKIYKRHQNYERKLDEFKKKRFLTEKEEIEEKELKKKKLAEKDRMYFLINEFKKIL
ncbi:MAG: hypothetical protein JW755_03515 [Candidatus Aminicenantes bacterium]|nr:hypothetical protein [Candidatus Aminicenantes bacterium]